MRSSFSRFAKLLDATTSVTRGSSGEIPASVAPLLPRIKLASPAPKPTAVTPPLPATASVLKAKVRVSNPTLPAAKPSAAAEGANLKQTRGGKLAGVGDRLQSRPIPHNLSDRGQGLEGLEKWLVEKTNASGLGSKAGSLKSILVEASRVDGLVVLDLELQNEPSPKEGRRIPVSLPTAAAEIELNGQRKQPPPSITPVGRNGIVSIAFVVGGSPGNSVVEISSGFVIGEEGNGQVKVIVCAHTIQSIALKFPQNENVPTRAYIVSSPTPTSSDAPIEVQLFAVESVASAVLASDIVLLNVSTTPSHSSINGKLDPVTFSSLPVTSFPLPSGSPLALSAYTAPVATGPSPPSYQELARRAAAQQPKPKPRSTDPLDDIFFRLPNDTPTPRSSTPTINNPNPFVQDSSTYFNDNFRPNTSSKSRVDIEAERKKILAVIREMTAKDRAAVEELSAAPMVVKGIELEKREFQFGRVVEYKDDHARIIEIGSSDNLHTMTFTQIPSPGMSGSPIICPENGNVVGIVRGSSNRYGEGRVGFGTPAEAIFSMFKLPGFDKEGKLTLEKNRQQKKERKEGIQADETSGASGKDEK